MPIIKSAQKRVRQEAVRRERNVATKRKLRARVREFEAAVKARKKTDVQKRLNEAQSAIDTAVKKHVIHRNKANRLKTRMSAAAKTVMKPSTANKKPSASSRATPKKPAAKK